MKEVVEKKIILDEDDVVEIIAKKFKVSKENVFVKIPTNRDDWGILIDLINGDDED
jgi:hypothetical protein